MLLDIAWKGLEASSDESGKGDFFGGLHVCAFYLNQDVYDVLKRSNLLPSINDSKTMSDKQIEQLAELFLKLFKDNISIVSLDVKSYNTLYSKVNNLNVLLAIAHNEAWVDLVEKCHLDKACKKTVDQFTPADKYYEYLSLQNVNAVKLLNFETKAESKYLSCAIASIIARYCFIKEIQDIRQTTGCFVPLGNSYAPSNDVVQTFLMIQKNAGSKEGALKYCKNHFKTLDKIETAYKNLGSQYS